MNQEKPEASAAPSQSGLFPATRWTRIRQVGQADQQLSAAALEEICRIYWYPTFVTARSKHRLDHHQAEDLTQGFWAWMLEGNFIERADQERGKFRSYLLTCFQRFIGHEWRKNFAQKRGGGAPHISIQSEDWNERYEREMEACASPDDLLERVWDDAALESAFSQVEGDWIEKGKGQMFTVLKGYLSSGAERGQMAAIAKEHGLTEENVRKMVSRLRQELREAGKQWLGKAN